MKWHNLEDRFPPPDREVLVFVNGKMLVDQAFYYSEEYLKPLAEFMTVKYIEDRRKTIGHFEEFGRKYYFDGKEVIFWMELPTKPILPQE